MFPLFIIILLFSSRGEYKEDGSFKTDYNHISNREKKVNAKYPAIKSNITIIPLNTVQ